MYSVKRAPSLARVVRQNTFVVCALFGGTSPLVLAEGDEDLIVKLLLGLLIALLACAAAAGGHFAARAPERRRA